MITSISFQEKRYIGKEKCLEGCVPKLQEGCLWMVNVHVTFTLFSILTKFFYSEHVSFFNNLKINNIHLGILKICTSLLLFEWSFILEAPFIATSYIKFFCKGPNSKYLSLCRPDSLCFSFLTLLLQSKSSYRYYANKWVWVCSIFFSPPLGVHMSILYICVSTFALQTGSSVPFF